MVLLEQTNKMNTPIVPVPFEEIKNFVSYCYENGNGEDAEQVGVILNNGYTLFGCLREQMVDFHDNVVRNSLTMKKGYLELYYDEPFKETSVFIPCKDILGLFPLSIKQEKIESNKERWADNYTTGSIYDELFHDLLVERALLLKYEIHHSEILYNLSGKTTFFNWGKVKLKGETTLYSDWNYFKRTSSQKLNSIGIGCPFFSLAIGWENSLWSFFYNKLKKKSLSHNICDGESKIKGYIRFFDLPSIDKNQDPIETLVMEGEKWYPAAFTQEKIKDLRDLKKKEWKLIYFKSDSFLFPVRLWSKIDQEVSLLVDSIEFPMSCKYGTSNYFIKVRAAIS